MMRILVGTAIGAMGGYALARTLEAKAQGVPIETALRHWRIPVVDLKAIGKLATNPNDKAAQKSYLRGPGETASLQGADGDDED